MNLAVIVPELIKQEKVYVAETPLFAINEKNTIQLFSQNDDNIYLIKNIKINGNLNSFHLNISGEKLLFAIDNKLCMFRENNIQKILCCIDNKKIISCYMCENGNTILITGINNHDNYFVQCITMKNNQFISYNFTEFPFYNITDLNSVLSLDGKFGLISCDMYDNYNGVVWMIN
jgi:DNA gyrase/topoisomerase IV subunit B